MKLNKKSVIFVSTVLTAMLVLILCIYFIALRFKAYHIIQYEGLAVTNKKLTENLYNTKSKEEKTAKAVKLTEQTVLYKNKLGVFAGEEQKISINIDYPIYVNNNTGILMLSDDYKLYTDHYEIISGYEGSTLSRGVLYNYTDLQRADENTYIFIKNSQDVFFNVSEIKVKTANREYTIPENSMIYFTKTTISYYTLEGENFEYYLIEDIDLGSKITVNEEEQNYENLLKKLELIGVNTQTENNNYQNSLTEDTIIEETNTNTNDDNEIKDDEKPDEDKTNGDNTSTGENEYIYIKPEVSVNSDKANVYTMLFGISINDPAQRISSPITLTAYKGEEIYLRKQIIQSGNIMINGFIPDSKYNIVMQYQYKNEKGQTVEKTIFEKEMQTQKRETLEPIEIEWENGEISSNKITLNNFKILTETFNESVIGITKASIIINNEITYTIPTQLIRELINGQTVNIETTNILESDTKINYEIKFYDLENEEIKIKKNKGQTVTSKQKPQASMQITKQDLTEITLKVTLNNKDSVTISNYYIDIFTLQGQFVRRVELDVSKKEQKIRLNNLAQNQYYVAQLHGTYSLADQVAVEDEVMNKIEFITKPISALGYMNIEIKTEERTESKLQLQVRIDSIATNSELISLLNLITIQLEQEGEEVGKKEFAGNELEKLKNGEVIEFNFENLNSNTEYTLKPNTKINVGGNIEEIETVQQNSATIKTLKKAAVIEIRDQFVTENMIDLEIRVIDQDNAVEKDSIRLEVRDDRNKMVYAERITKNEEFKRSTYNQLEEGKNYTLLFIAEQYNLGDDNTYYQTEKILRRIVIPTESGISGEIKLNSIKRKPEGKNLADMKSKEKWTTLFFNNGYNYMKEYNEETKTLTLGMKGAYRTYDYNLTDYIGEKITISFYAKATNKNDSIYFVTNRGQSTTSSSALLKGYNRNRRNHYNRV